MGAGGIEYKPSTGKLVTTEHRVAKLRRMLPESLLRGAELRAALHYFSHGLRFVLGGLAVQSVGQLLMLAVFICLQANVDLATTEKLFKAARMVSVVGVFLGFYGRRKCVKHAVAIRGQWLLVAALVCDVAALLAMLSPMFPALPRVRDAWFLPEIASMGFVLLFLARLGNVIDRPEIARHAMLTLAVGAVSLVTLLIIFALVPPARMVGVLLPVAALRPAAILWAVLAVTAAALYGWLLLRMIRTLREFQDELLMHTVESYFKETD